MGAGEAPRGRRGGESGGGGRRWWGRGWGRGPCPGPRPAGRSLPTTPAHPALAGSSAPAAPARPAAEPAATADACEAGRSQAQPAGGPTPRRGGRRPGPYLPPPPAAPLRRLRAKAHMQEKSRRPRAALAGGGSRAQARAAPGPSPRRRPGPRSRPSRARRAAAAEGAQELGAAMQRAPHPYPGGLAVSGGPRGCWPLAPPSPSAEAGRAHLGKPGPSQQRGLGAGGRPSWGPDFWVLLSSNPAGLGQSPLGPRACGSLAGPSPGPREPEPAAHRAPRWPAPARP